MSIPDDSLIAHDPQHGIDHGHTCNLKNSCHNTSNHGQSCGVKSKNGKTITAVWPQDLAFVGALRKRPSYEELTMTQWLLGFLRIAEEKMDQIRKQNMYTYLTELMHATADNSWAAAKGAHAVLMYRMQDGVLNWHDLAKIRKKLGKLMLDSNAKKGSAMGSPVGIFNLDLVVSLETTKSMACM